LATWLHSILYHIAVDKVRSDSKELSVDEVVGKWMNSEYSVDIEADLIRKETQMEVREALRRLPYNYRAAIIFHDAEGLSAKEISQLCGASLSAIKQRILRGRMMLLTALKSVDVSKLSTDTGSLSCWESRQMISDYLDDSLAQRQRNALEQHLSSCTTCPPLYRSLVGLRRVLGDLCEGDDDVPSEIRDRVLAKLSIGG